MTTPPPGDNPTVSPEIIRVLSIGSDPEFRRFLRDIVTGDSNLRLMQIDSMCDEHYRRSLVESDLVIIDARDGPDMAVEYLRSSGSLHLIRPTIYLARAGVPSLHTEVETVAALDSIGDAITRFADRKDREHTLAESERLYKELFEKAGDEIFIHEPGKKFIAVNVEACRNLGYSREELLKLRPEDVNCPESAKKVAERSAKLLRGEDVEFEVTHRKKDGSHYPAEVKLRKFTYMGRPAIIADVRDISERKLAQEKLRRANEKLTLLGSVTRHDISNRLASVLGYINLSEEHGISDDQRAKYMQKIKESIDAIEEQMRFTGDYQKAGTKEPVWVDIGSVIEAAGGAFDFEAITLSPELHGLELYVDPMIEKVFWNLLDNAIRHGNGVTTVRFSADHRDGGVVLVVEDDGQGIPGAEKDRIFEAGFGKHTGMGLFLIKEILGVTGISITENGAHGKGARFEILVPDDKHRRSAAQPPSPPLGT